MPDDETAELLKRGVAAVKAKQMREAQVLLRQVIEQEPHNVTAWIWLSTTLTDPLNREACLERAQKLAPDNGQIRRGLAVARQRATDYMLSQGIDAAENGDREGARKWLTDVVMRDQMNVEAWIWLSRVIESAEELEICFENILDLDPGNEEAREGLQLLREAEAAASASPWDAIEDGEGEVARVAPTLAGDILGEEYREKYRSVEPEPEPEPEHPSVALWARFEDRYLCPYCAAPTEEEARRCPACGSRLWLKSRARRKRSTLLWILILIQVVNTVFAATLPFLILFVVGFNLGIRDFTLLLPAYLGLESELAPQVVQAATTALPRFVFFLLWLPALALLAFTIALYLRWKPVFYFLLVSSILGLASSIGALATLADNVFALAGGIFGILLSIVNFVLVLKLEEDFQVKRSRLLLSVDPDIKTGVDALLRGRVYAREGMWGLAAIHFRRAAALNPSSPDEHIAVAQACVHLKESELARYALERARELQPGDGRVDAVLELLERQTSGVAGPNSTAPSGTVPKAPTTPES